MDMCDQSYSTTDFASQVQQVVITSNICMLLTKSSLALQIITSSISIKECVHMIKSSGLYIMYMLTYTSKQKAVGILGISVISSEKIIIVYPDLLFPRTL